MPNEPVAPDPETQPTPLGKQDELIEEAEETGTVDPADTEEGAAQQDRNDRPSAPRS